jgi:predicted transcriptional regulator
MYLTGMDQYMEEHDRSDKVAITFSCMHHTWYAMCANLALEHIGSTRVVNAAVATYECKSSPGLSWSSTIFLCRLDMDINCS